MWNLKKYNTLVNIQKRSRHSDIEDKLVVTSGETGKRQSGLEGGRHKLLCVGSSRMYGMTQGT